MVMVKVSLGFRCGLILVLTTPTLWMRYQRKRRRPPRQDTPSGPWGNERDHPEFLEGGRLEQSLASGVQVSDHSTYRSSGYSQRYCAENGHWCWEPEGKAVRLVGSA